MNRKPSVLIIEENSFVPLDVRVWYESLTLRDAGWDVTVICLQPPEVRAANTSGKWGSTADLEGITVLYFPLRPAERGMGGYVVEYLSAFFGIARLSWRAWRQRRFDVLHVCNPPDIFFPLELFYRVLGAAVVFDHHDLFPEFVAHRFHGPLGKVLHGAALLTEYLTSRSANAVIAVNESYRQVAIQRSHVRPDRVVVVRNGPRIQSFAPVPPVEALKRGFAHLVCYIGVMGHEDGIAELLEAIRHVIKDLGRQDISFALLGGGALHQWGVQRIAEWGLDRYVEMPGMVKDRLLIRQYLSTADVCLSPEPLSPLNAKSTFIKVGEYMAMGKPVVAFDLPETRWTAEKAAVYLEPGDVQGFGRAIVELLDRPEDRAAMGAFARQRFLGCLGWEHQAPHLLEAYARARRLRAGKLQ